jgi:membrane fusion protein (multidrug efflux system)
MCIVACSTEKKTNNKKDKFTIIQPVIKDTTYFQDYIADIQAVQNVEIRARVQGFLEKIYVDEGSFVQAGQALFSISSQSYQQALLKAQAALKSAYAEVESAKVKLQNTKILVDKNVVAKAELDLAQANLNTALAKVDEANADVSQANLNLSLTTIKAPFDGIINRIPNKTGSLIEEGSLLTSISNTTEVFAYFNVSESEYLRLKREKENNRSKEVELVLANNEAYPHKGIIETVESEFDKNTGNIAFRARFENPEKLLKHGSSGKIRLSTVLKNAMLVPQKSTFEIQDKIYVYVVDKNNQVQMRSITPKARMPHLYVVSSGLSSEEKIIYEGIQQVKVGETILTEEKSFANFIAQANK